MKNKYEKNTTITFNAQYDKLKKILKVFLRLLNKEKEKH